MIFDPDLLHDPEFRTRVRAARALIAERVRRGVATPAEHLGCRRPRRDARRGRPETRCGHGRPRPPSAMRFARPRSPPSPSTSASSRPSPTKPTETTATTRRCTDGWTWDGGRPTAGQVGSSEVLRHRPALGRRPGRVVRHHPRGLPVPGQHHIRSSTRHAASAPTPDLTRAEWAVTRVSTPGRPGRRPGTAAPPSAGESGTTRSSGSGFAAASRRRPEGAGDVGSSRTARPAPRRLRVRLAAARTVNQHPVAGGRLGDVAPCGGRSPSLAPHPRHEEQAQRSPRRAGRASGRRRRTPRRGRERRGRWQAGEDRGQSPPPLKGRAWPRPRPTAVRR